MSGKALLGNEERGETHTKKHPHSASSDDETWLLLAPLSNQESL